MEELSSETINTDLRVMASISTGRCWFTATSLAYLVALYTASTSFPSTRIDSIPYPCPLLAIPSPAYWSSTGVEIA